MDMKGRKEIAKRTNALERLVIEYVSVASIRPNSYNPNQQSDHEFELLVRSIDEDGFTQPIVCQQATREFVDGEHRWTAAIVHHYLRKNGLEISATNCREARDRRFEVLDDLAISESGETPPAWMILLYLGSKVSPGGSDPLFHLKATRS